MSVELSWLLSGLLLGGLGMAVGFAGGLFGIGGGIVLIPALVLLAGMPQPLAQGTALLVMAPNLTSAWWRYLRGQAMPWRQMLVVATSGILLTCALASFSARLEPRLLQVIFGSLMLLLSLAMAWPSAAKSTPEAGGEPEAMATQGAARRADDCRHALIGAAGGSAMGLLGVGGGLLATPLLTLWLKAPWRQAQALSLSLVMPCTWAALAVYASHDQVAWFKGLCLAAGGLLAVPLGVGLARRLPAARMRQAFAAMLFLTALAMLLGGRAH